MERLRADESADTGRCGAREALHCLVALRCRLAAEAAGGSAGAAEDVVTTVDRAAALLRAGLPMRTESELSEVACRTFAAAMVTRPGPQDPFSPDYLSPACGADRGRVVPSPFGLMDSEAESAQHEPDGCAWGGGPVAPAWMGRVTVLAEAKTVSDGGGEAEERGGENPDDDDGLAVPAAVGKVKGGLAGLGQGAMGMWTLFGKR